jgi:hypothetical protein
MPQEMNEGVAYLRALKQTTNRPDAGPTEPASADKPADTASSAATVGERFQGSDKRRAPRYKCEGSAQIREDGKEVHTWATFSDVSVHGCYVEAQATYPAGTVLHMKMEANDIRFEAQGTVRVSYPYLGMGVAFTNISAENEEHLRRLLATISHPSAIMGPGIASSLPSTAPLEAMPIISDPAAAIQELIEFFESRQMLMRDDFVRLLKKSQK